ncbi:MAG: DUF1461 domain-containing protein [Ectothiorhodospiraceae bacterium]|jgi:hypothetical protein
MRNTRSAPRTLTTALAGLAAVICAFLVSAALAWQLLSQVNFGYRFLYGALDIDAHIARYGPENRFRHGFETTSRAERIALFGGIVDAINNGGEGLRELRYHPAGGAATPLLRAPEIEHLELVAGLVNGVRLLGLIAAGVLAALAILMHRFRIPLSRRGIAGGIGLALAAGAAVTIASFDGGKTGLFGRLHEMVFPPGHQWFFYYQDSLMTTLMKAPDLFGPMAAMLAVVTLLIVVPLLMGFARFVGHHD